MTSSPYPSRTVTELDSVRIDNLVRRLVAAGEPQPMVGGLLDYADIVPSREVGPDIVTMYTRVSVCDPQTQLVRDVHEFPGHIACDAASAAELVVPLVRADGSLLGVLDLDSPTVGRFDAADAAGLEAIAARFLASLD